MKRKGIIKANQVSEIKEFSLGGYPQKVLLDGRDAANPLMLVLHGGPGSPIPFSVGCRGMFPDFTEQFVMVYWDQLGCGINDYPIDDSFTIEHYVGMTVDLVTALKKEYPDNPLILMGVSWGSVLTVKAAGRIPDQVDAVMTYGQVLNRLFFNDAVFSAIRQAKLPPKTAESLSALQKKSENIADITTADIMLLAKWIRRYTEGYQAKTSRPMPMGAILGGMLFSPDYSFRNFTAVLKNGFMKNTSIFREMLQLDLTEGLENIQVPYHIMQGSTDIVTATDTIAQMVQGSQNRNLSIRVLENNGHIPSADGMDEILSEGISFLNRIALKK